MNHTTYDIIIVGLGPVGLFAANVFGKAGWKVLAIEQYETRWPYPRAIGMDDEILRELGAIGLQEEVLARTHEIKGLQFIHKENEVFYTTAFKSEGFLPKGPFLYYQPELEEILEGGSQRYPTVELRYGCKLEDFEQNQEENEVEILLRLSDGNSQKLCCTYLIACDGANSSVRQKLGIKEKSFRYEGYILKIDAEAKDLQKFTYDTEYAQKYCSTDMAWVRMLGRDNHCRWEFQFKGKVEDPELISEKQALKYIAAIGEDVENLRIINVAFYRYRSLVQKEWQRGNCFIAGDAAHLTAPYIGQGLCAGIRDISNLAWKLGEIRDGKCDKRLMGSYQKERSPHISRFIFLAMIIGWIFKTRFYHLLLAFKYLPFLNTFDQELDIPPPKLGKGLFDKHKIARRMVPYFPISQAEEKSCMIDELCRGKWTLVNMDQKDSQFLEFAEEHMPEQISLSSSQEVNRHLKKWMDDKKVSWLFIRPDLYIYSAGKTLRELEKAYKKLQHTYQSTSILTKKKWVHQ